MSMLSASEAALIAGIDAPAMLARVETWCAINTGTRNLGGLAQLAALLADAFAALPGEVRLAAPAPVEAMGTDGRTLALDHGQHVVLSVRPHAPRRYLLTGHMDTVYKVRLKDQRSSHVTEGIVTRITAIRCAIVGASAKLR